MKPPTKGAINGPTKTVSAYSEMAAPRVVLLYKSASTPGTTVSWLAPNIPAKKRHMTKVWIFWATADAIVKIPPPNIPIVKGHFLPRSSDAGAQIRGPDAKPRTYRVVPSVPTTVPTPKVLLASSIPGANMALVRETIKVPEQTRIELKSLREIGVSLFPEYPGL